MKTYRVGVGPVSLYLLGIGVGWIGRTRSSAYGSLL